MEKLKELNHYQKGVLIFMIVMALVFAVIYPMTISRVGFAYKDKIGGMAIAQLVPGIF